MSEILTFVVSGFILGLTAGISPGPLLTLVISETLKHNRLAGIKVALAPLITDGPILLISLFLLTKLSSLDTLLGAISLFGAGFLLYLGYESITIKNMKTDINQTTENSLRRGIITNALSPHPYLFYLSIGGPLMVKAIGISIFALLSFIGSFLLLLVGSKIIIALIVEKSRGFLKSKAYIYTLKFLGLALIIFALIFIKDALTFFHLI
jgi:threonine/homoserine/homoserine lactone efflux protein